MNYKLSIFLLPILLVYSCKQVDKSIADDGREQISLVDLVNPLMGTDSKHSLSNGNTYPAIATPWGMNFWTPMTSCMGDGWAYKYNDNKIRGIKQTHQPSPWINDYAA
ncbi:MAG: glycoside hydrolase family 92 protein, partial [Bacteroidales bacterium]|nr:glycoside hydrolase family 92 protein [Bacteroidales bacterium]